MNKTEEVQKELEVNFVKVEKFFTDKDFRKHPRNNDPFWNINCIFQKRIDPEVQPGCERNDGKLWLTVEVFGATKLGSYVTSGVEIHGYLQEGLTFKAASLGFRNVEDLEKNFDKAVEKLKKMWETLKEPVQDPSSIIPENVV